MYLRQQINSLVFEGAVIDCFSIKLKILVAEIRPFFTKAQKMCCPRFQVVELSRFCAQRPLLRIAASREHYVQVRIFLRVIFVLSVHAAIHCHLIFLSKPTAKLDSKFEPLPLLSSMGMAISISRARVEFLRFSVFSANNHKSCLLMGGQPSGTKTCRATTPCLRRKSNTRPSAAVRRDAAL